MKNKLSFIFIPLLIFSNLAAEILEIPEFNQDSAFAYVKAQVQFGPRVPGLPSHTKCADFLKSQLEKTGALVTIQPFEAEIYTGEKLHFRNIIASFDFGRKNTILLAAHWDTRKWADKDTVDPMEPIQGANDGASGVAVLLEIARILGISEEKPPVNVDIILFDGEDYGPPEGYREEKTIENAGKIWWCLGSQFWAKNPHQPDYEAKFTIVADMVGAEGAHFYMEGGSIQFAAPFVKKVWKNAARVGHEEYFIRKKSSGIMDDHIFISKDAGIPSLVILDHNLRADQFFRSYHHTHSDNLDLINPLVLKAVGETILYTLYKE
jgi:hypothetical protein